MYKNILKYCILFNLILTFDLISGKPLGDSQNSSPSLDNNGKILINTSKEGKGKVASSATSTVVQTKEETKGKNKNETLGVVEATSSQPTSNPNETLPNTEDVNFNGDDWNLNNGALLRGFYVFIGLGALVVLYIVVKIIKLKRKRAMRKYGILANNDDVVEMTPLGVDDEDEDMTLFEINSHTRS